MRTEKVKIFTFDELSKDSQTKAIEKHRDFIAEVSDQKYLLEDWTEHLATKGFDNADINYSGFYSQDDGASFTADVDVKKFIANYNVKGYKQLINYLDKTGAYINILALVI